MSQPSIPVLAIRRLRMGTDGDGIRTLIGTIGCPLRCRYCLNPQSWDGTCPTKVYTPKQLYDEISVDNLYFRATGGGITLGGGEPLLHMDAIAEFAVLCPKEWSLWIETSLNVPSENVVKASGVFHHFVVDIKTTVPTIYSAYTGGEFEPVWQNLLMLKALIGSERITVRLPLIPDFVDEAIRTQSITMLSEVGFINIDMFSYFIP